MAKADVPWAQLLAHRDTVARYEAKVYRRGPGRCDYWIGAISDSGHGKIRAGNKKTTGKSWVVTAHVLGFGLVHGVEALDRIALVRHTCDSPSCQLPEHWIPGTRQDNALDYASRSMVIGHALTDTRGAAGRAVAIRDAILDALDQGRDVELAIAGAIRAGQPGGAEQSALDVPAAVTAPRWKPPRPPVERAAPVGPEQLHGAEQPGLW